MILNDYKCIDCGNVHEDYVDMFGPDCNCPSCPECGGTTAKQFPAPQFKFKRGQMTGSAIDKWSKARESHIKWEKKHLHQSQPVTDSHGDRAK